MRKEVDIKRKMSGLPEEYIQQKPIECKTMIDLTKELIGRTFKLVVPVRFEIRLYKIGHPFTVTDYRDYGVPWGISDGQGNRYRVSEDFLNNQDVLNEIYDNWREGVLEE